jgi:hypothetical protein
MEFGKSHPSTNSWLSKLYIQISILHMSVVPGPTSQDAVIKRVLASPGLQCSYLPTYACRRVEINLSVEQAWKLRQELTTISNKKIIDLSFLYSPDFTLK